MRLLLGALLAAAPCSAADWEEGWAASRRIVEAAQDQRRERRDALLKRWVSGPSGGLWDEEPGERVTVLCGAAACADARRQEALDRLAAAFARMPAFLNQGALGRVSWQWLAPGARRGGEAEGNVLTLRAAADQPIDDILCHELAHIYQRAAPAPVEGYLALRARSAPLRLARARILALAPPLAPPGAPPRPLPEEARRLLAQAEVPRRFDDDVHALRSDGEYWAVSVELAYLARGDGRLLQGRLSAREANYLAALGVK